MNVLHRLNQTFNSYYLDMWATEWFLKWEIKTLVDKLRDKEEEIKKLNERIRFLEQCLDNKEKVNKSLREENKRLSDFLECES